LYILFIKHVFSKAGLIIWNPLQNWPNSFFYYWVCSTSNS